MAHSIPSSDFVAICLLLIDYDLDARIADVIARETEREQRHTIAFGAGGDFYMAFIDLIFHENRPCSLATLPDLLAATPLREWIPLILRLNEFYANDEGGSWDDDKYAEISAGSEYDYRMHNAPFRAFFADPATLTTDAARLYFAAQNIRMDEM